MLISLGLMGTLFQPFIAVIVLSSVIAGMFYPVHHRLEKRIKPVYASLVTCVMVFFLLFIPIVFVFTIMASEARSLIVFLKDSTPRYRSSIFSKNTESSKGSGSSLSDSTYLSVTGTWSSPSATSENS
jgi:predicted PurR-regulated permease PerM